MLQLPDLPLSGNALRWLQRWQTEIDALPDYAARVTEAQRAWKSKNRSANKTFVAVKKTLTEMQGRLRRCAYCEDSCATEIEHVRPKSLYPEHVFDWNNFLYACGGCNGGKLNSFRVYVTGTLSWADIQRTKKAPVLPPLVGDSVLIDPRHENPLDFLRLDLYSFQFDPLADAGTREYERAEYTINTLSLWREPLRDTRENAACGFLDKLQGYIKAKAANDPPHEIDNRRIQILRSPHQTVWREMQRQYRSSPKLTASFVAAPEALTW
ncbi:MAG: hypothetical protein H7Y38_17995 [Armatimonadetes bacterium]|nr:hypothetical protein [Armatimonadota bacterium]